MTKNNVIKTINKQQKATLDRELARLKKEFAKTDLSSLDRLIAQLEQETKQATKSYNF